MANDFSKDSSCVALWCFESGALLNDSKGSNTLTASASSPTSDGTWHKEGAYSAKFVRTSSQILYRTDANLSAGFPLKSGDTTKKASFCFWCKPTSLSSSWNEIVSKYDISTGNKRSFGIWVNNTQIVIGWGYNSGGSKYTINTGIYLAINRAYHISVVLDGIAKTLFVRVWDETAATVYTFSNNPASEIYASSADFIVGCEQGDTADNYDGYLDELVVFNRLLTSAHIDNIRSGTYGPLNLITSCAVVSTVSTPLLAVLRPLACSAPVVSDTAAPILAVQRNLAALAAVTSETSDISLLCQAIFDLVTAAAVQSQTSSPVLTVERSLSSAPVGQTQTSAALLAILRTLVTAAVSETQGSDITLKVLRDLATAASVQSAMSEIVLQTICSLITEAHVTTNTSAAALAILRNLTTSVAIQSVLSDIELATGASLNLVTIAAILTQTSDIELTLAFHESLRTRAKRFYGVPPAGDLWAQAQEWIKEEEVTSE